jgi:hypothetical protein
MKKLKNWLGKTIFLASAVALKKSMNWISDDKSRLAAMNALIHLGETAQAKVKKWNF